MKRIKIKFLLSWVKRGLLLGGFVGLPFFLVASKSSLFDQISYQEVVEVTIEGDFSTLTNNRRSGEAQKMVLTYLDANEQLQTWNTKVTLRGHFRRMRCEAMPPLKLNFKKSELKAAGLAKFDDMKLVTQCMDQEDSKQWVLKEYLAYKLFNELTEDSYRVQLLKVTYKDTGNGETIKQWGFLIEDTAELRKRIGAEKSALKRNAPVDSLDQTAFYKMAVFQYMIGNSDWDFRNGRNIKLVKRAGEYVTIPYDFDFSGLVDADYAIPNANYPLVSIQDRNYMGFEEDLANLDETLAFFQTKKAAISRAIKKFKRLSWVDRQEVHAYINTFYGSIPTIDYHAKKTLTAAKLVSQNID